MKGIINKGIQELVELRFGSPAWEAICREIQWDEPSFATTWDYPDRLTVDLVTAVAEYSGLTPDAVMVEFGKHWISNTGKASYPALYALAGDNARDFLKGMHRVHRQVTLLIPNAGPPKLLTEDLPDGGVAIHYVSNRKLCPVLHGLILGVGIYFGQQLDVQETRCTRHGDPECVFEVRF